MSFVSPSVYVMHRCTNRMLFNYRLLFSHFHDHGFDSLKLDCLQSKNNTHEKAKENKTFHWLSELSLHDIHIEMAGCLSLSTSFFHLFTYTRIHQYFEMAPLYSYFLPPSHYSLDNSIPNRFENVWPFGIYHWHRRFVNVKKFEFMQIENISKKIQCSEFRYHVVPLRSFCVFCCSFCCVCSSLWNCHLKVENKNSNNSTQRNSHDFIYYLLSFSVFILAF